MHTIETISGRIVDLVEPDCDQIDIHDIAWSLARIARWNGHTTGVIPYTVAQHSLWVAGAAQEFSDAEPSVVLHALLHDAHEAYLGDITTPVKMIPDLRPVLKTLEASVQDAIYRALQIAAPDREATRIIKETDRLARLVEAFHLKPSHGARYSTATVVPRGIVNRFRAPWRAARAYAEFAEAYERLAERKRIKPLWT